MTAPRDQEAALGVADLEKLLNGQAPFVALDDLRAGYGRVEILHGINLLLNRGGSLCLIGPNGAGKSTVLHAIYGFARRFGGAIAVGGRDIGDLPAGEKLRRAKVAYILQDSSIFPQMTVEENLLMGGYTLEKRGAARGAAEEIFAKYPRLAARRREAAGALSGGERRLLEISRALITAPDVLLVDEPSIGLEPRYIEMVFEILGGLQRDDGKTIVMVEQNAKKGLAFADLGYVLAAGRLIMADRGDALLENPEVGRLFLGG